jgi:aspartyl-tRNA(Asn)/glutamyl-tRNA(Gln) amidotransferase subunit C
LPPPGVTAGPGRTATETKHGSEVVAAETATAEAVICGSMTCGLAIRGSTSQRSVLVCGPAVRAARRTVFHLLRSGEKRMSVDAATVRRIAHLARIAVKDDEVEHLKGEINDVLAFVAQLSEVDVSGVEPMTSVTPMAMKKRADVVTDGEIADDIVRNAPAAQDHFFLVPKVVE